jgi:hypothetical protein
MTSLVEATITRMELETLKYAIGVAEYCDNIDEFIGYMKARQDELNKEIL